jgi:hypothetical protein
LDRDHRPIVDDQPLPIALHQDRRIKSFRRLSLGATGYLPGAIVDRQVRLEEAEGAVRMLELQPLAFRKALGEVFFQCVAALNPLAAECNRVG